MKIGIANDVAMAAEALRRVIAGTKLHQVLWIARTGLEAVRMCAENRPEGTWVTDDMIRGYTDLHHAGHAPSIEVWSPGDGPLGEPTAGPGSAGLAVDWVWSYPAADVTWTLTPSIPSVHVSHRLSGLKPGSQRTMSTSSEEVPAVWKGVVEVFRDYGYRRLRAKARIKFLVAKLGIEEFPIFKKAAAHPSYDEYWQGQALDKILEHTGFRDMDAVILARQVSAQWLELHRIPIERQLITQ